MDPREMSPARLCVLMAREASVAAVLRRGPSDYVQMWHWNTETDEFTAGQWFRGRCYEDSCDISSNGRYFISRMAKRGDDYHTSISRPPYFSALAYFPTDSYGGGGKFLSNSDVEIWSDLNDQQIKISEECPLKFYQLNREFDERARWVHLGWKVDWYKPEFVGIRKDQPERRGGEIEQAELWSDADLDHRNIVLCRRKTLGKLTLIAESRRSSRHLDDRVFLSYADEIYDLQEVTWADFDQRGRCIVAKNGTIREVTIEKGVVHEKMLADLNESRYKPLPPPDWALDW